MKICVFLGSPRKKGNTAYLLNLVMEKMENTEHQTEIIYLQDKKISGCRENFACQKVINKPGCSIKDDMQELYLKILEADCILIATPVFCWSFSAQIKLFLDRLYCLEKYAVDGSYISLVEGKRCGLIVTAGGDEFDGADLVVESYRRMVDFHRMENIGHLVAANIQRKKDFLRSEIKQKVKEFVKILNKKEK